jgi:hypothetical protein
METGLESSNFLKSFHFVFAAQLLLGVFPVTGVSSINPPFDFGPLKSGFKKEPSLKILSQFLTISG